MIEFIEDWLATHEDDERYDFVNGCYNKYEADVLGMSDWDGQVFDNFTEGIRHAYNNSGNIDEPTESDSGSVGDVGGGSEGGVEQHDLRGPAHDDEV